MDTRVVPVFRLARFPTSFPKVTDWRYSLLVAMVCVAGVRLFLTLYLAGASLLFPQPDLQDQYAATGVKVLNSGWEGLLLGVWQREDALWYQKIATVGYSNQDMTAEFFPLFPLLIRFLSLVSGVHPTLAGVMISEISLLGALFLLHRFLLPTFGPGVATRTLVYISLFPTAFFLHGPFSESLFLLLAVLAFYLVSRGRWVEASAVAFLAGLARPQGMLLGPALAAQLLSGGLPARQWRSFERSRGAWMRSAVLLVAPLLGLGVFLLSVDTAWRRPEISSGIGPGHGAPALPGAALVYAVQNFVGGEAYPIEVFNFLVGMAFVPLVLLALARLGAGPAVYAVLFYLAPLSRYLPGFALMSFSRYLLFLFPCFVALSVLGRRKRVHLAVIFLSLLWLAVWSAKFYTGYFVG